MMIFRRTLATAALLLGASLLLPCAAAAQAEALQGELATLRQLRAANRMADASDRAVGLGFQQALDAVPGDSADAKATSLKETALWEAADIHLAEANRWQASPDNVYAKRAVDAWTAYVDFATASGQSARLHRAVEFLQRSFVQANEYPEMFSYFVLLPPQYVNDKVVTRWEDRLRACSDYSRQGGRPWKEQDCVRDECRDSVAAFYEYAHRWLKEFPLKADARTVFAQRVERVPPSCRSKP